MYYLIRPVKPLETLESLQIKACGVGVAGGLLLGTIPQYIKRCAGVLSFQGRFCLCSAVPMSLELRTADLANGGVGARYQLCFAGF